MPCTNGFDWPLEVANRSGPANEARVTFRAGSEETSADRAPMPFFIRRNDFVERRLAEIAPIGINALACGLPGDICAVGGRAGSTMVKEPFEQSVLHLSYSDGLPGRAVMSLDRAGKTLWIQTEDGYCRYDPPGVLRCGPATPGLARSRPGRYRIVADPILEECAWALRPGGKVRAVHGPSGPIGSALREYEDEVLEALEADDIVLLNLDRCQQLWVLEGGKQYDVFVRCLFEDPRDSSSPCGGWVAPPSNQVPLDGDIWHATGDPARVAWVWGWGTGTLRIDAAVEDGSVETGVRPKGSPVYEEKLHTLLPKDEKGGSDTNVRLILPTREGVWIAGAQRVWWIPRKDSGDAEPGAPEPGSAGDKGFVGQVPRATREGASPIIKAMAPTDGGAGEALLVATDLGVHRCWPTFDAKDRVTCRASTRVGYAGPQDARITAAWADMSGRFWVGDSRGGVHLLSLDRTFVPHWADSIDLGDKYYAGSEPLESDSGGGADRGCSRERRAVQALVKTSRWLYIACSDMLFLWDVEGLPGSGGVAPRSTPVPIMFQKPFLTPANADDLFDRLPIARMRLDPQSRVLVATSNGLYSGPPVGKGGDNSPVYLRSVPLPLPHVGDDTGNGVPRNKISDFACDRKDRLWVIVGGSLSYFKVEHRGNATSSDTGSGTAQASDEGCGTDRSSQQDGTPADNAPE